MGFEVLDVGTRQPPPVESPWTGSHTDDADVVDLDALPEPPPDDDRPESGGPNWLRAPTMTRGRMAFALVAVLVTGLVAGAAWGGRGPQPRRAAGGGAAPAPPALAGRGTPRAPPRPPGRGGVGGAVH